MSELKSENNHNILVSVVVITYNSSKYVIETLESIRLQSYKNIELIISDDGSTDDTIEKCNAWIEKNKDRFVRAKVLTVACNTGIPANCNRAVRTCTGEWIKIIGGDDLLLKHCIDLFVSEISPEKEIVIGLVQNFYQRDEKRIESGTVPVNTRYFFFQRDAKFQHNYLLTKSFNFSPGAFIRRSLYQDLDYYEEQFRLLEDLPFWLKATAEGNKIHLCTNLTPCVLYRTNHESCSFTNSGFFNTKFYESLHKFYKEVIYKEVSYLNIVFYESEFIHHLSYHLIKKVFRNKRNKYTKKLNNFMEYLCLTHYIYPLLNYYYRRRYSKNR